MEACFSNTVCCSYRVPLAMLCLDKIRQANARQFFPDAVDIEKFSLVFIMEVLYVRYRILISDDEVDIVEMLTGFFRSKGYEVFSAYNGVETLKLAELQPDIILLDINMPKLDGIEVCKKIRDYVSCPILFLTARIEENDKVQGFSVGGDDYIVKPFSLVELEARVQAHLRREERHQTNTKVKFSGELLIDYSERNVYIQNQPIGLVKKEFDIVELLSQNAGQVFDKERIYERVWGYDSEGDSSVVAEHIRRIRTKIAAYTNKSYIETVWGCGYKWIR